MDFSFIRLLYSLVDIGAISSFRVTKERIYIVIKK